MKGGCLLPVLLKRAVRLNRLRCRRFFFYVEQANFNFLPYIQKTYCEKITRGGFVVSWICIPISAIGGALLAMFLIALLSANERSDNND